MGIMISPQKYEIPLKTIRIESAKKLLRETQKTMLEIIAECGFGSDRSFYRQFKEAVGESPYKYRTAVYW